MAPRLKKDKISKWSEWDRKRKIKENRRCTQCGVLIGWRRNKTDLCHHCATTNNRAEKASNWKGGRKINTGGYVEIYYPGEHHRKFQHGCTGYVMEHVLVWEKTNGKPIPDNMVIHHLNGIKTDNSPDNLAAVLPKNHGGWTYSQCLQKRIRELEAIIVKLSQ